MWTLLNNCFSICSNVLVSDNFFKTLFVQVNESLHNRVRVWVYEWKEAF